LHCISGHALGNRGSASHSKLDGSPNFLIIVADDLGWSDASPFGGEISTPNLQMLANRGTRFIDFHTASACSPTRSMLMSGTDNHIAGLGQMAETMSDFPNIWQGKVGYEGYLNNRVAALPEIMQDAGYFTTMSGKWHLGLTHDQFPASRGFDDSFALLAGGDNHYTYAPPISLLRPDYVRNFKVINYTTLTDFYSSDYFATQLIDSLKSNAENSNKPFFAYLPFSAPHWPLQAPPDVITKYKGVYDNGPAVLREKRLKTQTELGLLPSDVVASPVYTNAPEWETLTPPEQAFSAKTMEIYAAMVERMDFAIGRVVDYLKQSDQFENTFILFMSDNGADGVSLENLSILTSPQFNLYFNNSYENIGNKDSLVSYGPRWAQASTAPSRISKGHITEGGIRCPAIVHFPKFDRPLNISHEFTTVMDILPTVLELAGIPHPGTLFRNRTVVIPKGKSWVSHLLNPDEHVHHVHDEQDFIGWELFGEQAIRRGNYKAILIPNESNTAEWELYDLTLDKGELVNLAYEREDVLKELIEAWGTYEAEMGVFLPEDRWAIRYPSELLVLPSAQTTTTSPGEIANEGVITYINPVFSISVLLLWLCPLF
jgi:arylsulfatase A-like enzyme